MFNPRLPEVNYSGNKELSFYIKMLKDQVVFPKFLPHLFIGADNDINLIR